MAEAAGDRRSELAPFWAAAVVGSIALTLLCHYQILGYGLTDIDTFMLITEARVDQPGDLWDVASGKLTGGRAGRTANFYRPTAMLVFAALRAAFGWEPAGYHAVALALHATCGVLLAALCLRLAHVVALPRPRTFALGCAAIFLVHPVSVEVVPAVARLPDVLVTALGLAALLAAERVWHAAGTGGETGASRRRAGGWLAGFGVLFAATLGTKEPGVVFLAAVAVLAVALPAPSAASRLRRAALLLAPGAVLTVVYLAARTVVLGDAVGGYQVRHSAWASTKLVANLLWADLTVPGYSAAWQRVVPPFARLQLLDSAWFLVPLGMLCAGGFWVLAGRRRLGPVGPGTRLLSFACSVVLAHAVLFVVTDVYDRRLVYTAAAFWSFLPALLLVAVLEAFGTFHRDSVRSGPIGSGWRIVGRAAAALVVLAAAAGFAWQSPLLHRYEEWRSSGAASHLLTDAIAQQWARLPIGAQVVIANLPGGFDLDPMRATPYAAISSTNSPDIPSLRAWLDDRLPGRNIQLEALGHPRYLEALSDFRHDARVEAGWVRFNVPTARWGLDRELAGARGFRFREAGPHRVALTPIDDGAGRFLLVLDGEGPRFVPLGGLHRRDADS